MGRKFHAMHGRDHLPGGSDPIPTVAAVAAASGLPTITSGYGGIGVVIPTGTHVYPYDPTYGTPSVDSTDYSIMTDALTSSITGSSVDAIEILAAGTYAIFHTLNFRTIPTGVTNGQLSIATATGSVSDFFQGINTRTPTGTTSPVWEMRLLQVTGGALPFYLTSDLTVNGTGTYRANVWLNVIQLSPTPITVS